MTKTFPTLLPLILLATPLIAQTPPPPAKPAEPPRREQSGRLFISPMGEPFRESPDNAEAWFTQADADHDGRITLVEFRADAMRFFAKLDTDHDHEIGPEEIEHYEQVVAPETSISGGGPIDENFGHPIQDNGDGSAPAAKPKFDPAGQGVTPYSYLALPEPVIAADTDFNRGVSEREFLTAASRRFALLDTNHDGALTREELPKLGEGRPSRGKRGAKPPQD